MRARLKFSRAGVELIKSFEGLRQTAARLPDGRWTLGYGHTFSARDGATVTQEDADALLRFDLLPIVDAINNLVLVPLNQNQFDALVSFCFNIGVDNFAASSVLKRINEGRMTEAALAMDSWRSAEFNGQTYVLAPLIRRRAAEKSLFLTPEETNGTASSLLVRPVEDAGEGAGLPSEIDAPNHNGILSAQPMAAPETPIPAPTPPVEAPAITTLPPPYASPYATPVATPAPVTAPAFEISATPQPVPSYAPQAPVERQLIDLAAFAPRPAEPDLTPDAASQPAPVADTAPVGVVESAPTAYNYDPVPVMSPDVQAALARAQEEQRFQLMYEQEQKQREEARLQAEALAAAQAAEEVRQREEMQRREEARLQELQRQEVLRLEQERLEREAQVRAEVERQEQARQEAERYAAYRAEQERLERERLEQAQLEQARLQQEAAAESARQEAFRQEQERLERERLEQQRLEQERAAEAARQEAARLEQDRLESEAAARAEQARLEQARLEQARLEQDRLQQAAVARAEQERVDREQREREQAAAVAQPATAAAAADDAEKARKAEAAAALMRLYSPYGAGNLGRPLAPQRPADLTPQPQPRVQPEPQPLVQPQVSVPPQAAPHFGTPSRAETPRQETPQASAEETDPEPADSDDLMPSVFTSASIQSPSTMPPPQITALNPYARPIPGARTVPEAIVEVPRPTSVDMSAPSNAPFVAAQATETPSTQTKPAERQPEPHWREQLNRPLPGSYTSPEPVRPEAAPARAEMFGGGEGDWSLDGERIALSAEETEEESVSWWQMIVSTGWWILISVFGLICIGAAAALHFRATQDPIVLRSGFQDGFTTVSIICAAAGIFFVVVSVWLIMKRLGGLKN